MIIDTLRPEDVPQVVALQQQIVPYPIDPEQAAAVCAAMGDDSRIFTAREGGSIFGTVSGFCCRGLAGSFLAIEDLIVAEHLRGSGIGTRLMEAIHAYGKQRGCAYAILVSSGFRRQAHHFYEKIGYMEEVRGFRKEL